VGRISHTVRLDDLPGQLRVPGVFPKVCERVQQRPSRRDRGVGNDQLISIIFSRTA
jgi:hypothetical protein